MRGPLPVGIADPVERLRIVHAEMDALKASKQPLGAEAIWGLNDWFRDFAPPVLLDPTAAINFSTRLFNLLVTNFPGPQIPFYVLGRELTGVYPIGFLAQRHALAIAIISYNGQINFGLLADRDGRCPTSSASAAYLDEAVGGAPRRRPDSLPRQVAMATSWQEILDLGSRDERERLGRALRPRRAPRRLPPPAREPLEEPPGADRGDLGQPLRAHRRRDLGAARGGADPRRRRRADDRQGGRAARARGRGAAASPPTARRCGSA